MFRSLLFLTTILFAAIHFSFCQTISNNPVTFQTKDSTINEKPGLYLHFGIGGSSFSVRDEATSPLIYKSFVPGLNFGTYYYSNKVKFYFNYEFYYGFLKTRNYPLYDSNTAEAYNNHAVFNLLFNTNPDNRKKLHLFAGIGSSIIANFRTNKKYNNASLNYEFIGSLGPAFQLEKTWKTSKDYLNLGLFRFPLRRRILKLSSGFNIPIFEAVLRPTFTTVNDIVTGKSDIEPKYTKLTTFNHLVEFIGDINFYYYLLNRNAFRFSYLWKYYNYNPGFNSVRSVSGSFEFAVLFRLNNK